MKLCNIEGCKKESRARGWCKMHWKRWRTHGDPEYVRPAPEPKPRCVVEGCEKQKHGYIYCSKHYQRWKTSGDPLIVGCRHPGRPRMDSPSYAGIHKRLFYDRGKAAQFACVTCGSPAHEWSYDGGDPAELTENYRGTPITYSLDQERYSPRCRPCHRRMDDSLIRGRDSAGRWAAAGIITDDARITRWSPRKRYGEPRTVIHLIEKDFA